MYKRDKETIYNFIYSCRNMSKNNINLEKVKVADITDYTSKKFTILISNSILPNFLRIAKYCCFKVNSK